MLLVGVGGVEFRRAAARETHDAYTGAASRHRASLALLPAWPFPAPLACELD